MSFPDILRIGAVNFKVDEINGFNDFEQHVTKLVKLAVKQKIDLLVFPELFTLKLLSKKEILQQKEISKLLAEYYGEYVDLFSRLSAKHSFPILAGSNGKYFNTAHMFLPSQEVVKYDKIHLHYIDRILGFSPGSKPVIVDVEFGKVGLMICYDVGFPELARILALKGSYILLVPSAAPGESAWRWLRYCCHARAIENQSIVVHSCLVGRFKELKFDGKSAVIVSTDYEKNGVVGQGKYGEEDLAIGTINLKRFWKIRRKTKAPVLKDLRPDIYKQLCKMVWRPVES
ncbi:MAG: nitrilase-related carbon-nitrogen hydrolase [Candidatus Baldrarchaeia archaeon]